MGKRIDGSGLDEKEEMWKDWIRKRRGEEGFDAKEKR